MAHKISPVWNLAKLDDVNSRQGFLENKIDAENIQEAQIVQDSAKTILLLNEVMAKGTSKLKRRIREAYRKKGRKFQKLQRNDLLGAYGKVNELLKREKSAKSYALYPHAKQCELKYLGLLEESSSKKILHDIYIGNFQTDLFIPSIKYAVEVDGEIHEENSSKMKGDGIREILLKRKFGIHVHRVRNKELFNLPETQRAFVRRIKQLKSLPTTQLQRMWLKISIHTIAYAYAHPGEIGAEAAVILKELLKVDAELLSQLLSFIKKYKRSKIYQTKPPRLKDIKRKILYPRFASCGKFSGNGVAK